MHYIYIVWVLEHSRDRCILHSFECCNAVYSEHFWSAVMPCATENAQDFWLAHHNGYLVPHICLPVSVLWVGYEKLNESTWLWKTFLHGHILSTPGDALTTSHILYVVGRKKWIKDQWCEPSQGRQKGKAKERPRAEQPIGTKKGEKKASPSHGGKLSHPWPL
jgi:hypothetical protein